MIISRRILNYIDDAFLDITDQEFINVCNNVGIEVEQIIRKQEANGLKIVKIVDFYKHPNSDKLNIVKIQTSSSEFLEVVCGAPNVEKDKYAIYAPVGCKLWNGFEITPKEIRGVVSKGMLCGYNEITLCDTNMLSKKDASGIVLLDKAKIGDTKISNYILTNDTIYDVSIPSNRNDLNSHLLFANEILTSMKKNSIVSTEAITKNIEINKLKNIDQDVCSDFSLIKIPNFKYDASWKEKELLISCGYKIQNNILDLMNLFTIYYGNPIHVYNADFLRAANISVELNTINEKFIALDGNQYDVPKKSICIYNNQNELINIAGIIGSEKYKYVDEAKEILIEVANFNSNYIRATSDKMKISTKAQSLFLKPLSSWITQKTFFEIFEFMANNGLNPIAYANFSIISPLDIVYDYNDLYKFLGIKKAISFNKNLERSIYHVHPSRLDLANQYDVFEEVLKTMDVNQLKAEAIQFDIQESPLNKKYININKMKSYLCDNGMLEVKTYNLSSEEDYNKFNFFKLQYKAKLLDPISKNREIFRLSAIDELLKVIQYNLARKRSLSNIFEFSSLPINDKESKEVISFVFNSTNIIDNKNFDSTTNSFMFIKNIIKNMFNKINLNVSFDLIENDDVKEVLSKKLVIVNSGNKVGYIAKVKNNILKKYDILHDVYVAVVESSIAAKEPIINPIQKISMFPTVTRDINVINKSVSDVNKILKSINKVKYVKNSSIINKFENDTNITYTIRVEISSLDNTLSTKEIDAIMEEIKNIINK